MTAPELPSSCWPIDLTCTPDEWDAYGPEVQDIAVAMAERTLYRLTAGRVGGCPVKVRPMPHARCQGLDLTRYPGSGLPWRPYLQADGSITNCGCNAGTDKILKLPGYVGRVDEVKIDGVVTDPDDYAILDHSSIVWRGDDDFQWPKTQDLGKDDNHLGTYSITYLAAHEVDALGAIAVGALAVEYAKACTPGSKGCRLPKGTKSVVRTGVSYDLVTETFPNGRTGIDEIDRFIAIYNPRSVQVRPTVWSPDQQVFHYE